MPRFERRWLRSMLCLALALGLQTTVSGTAWAEGSWYRHHGGSGYGYGHSKHRGGYYYKRGHNRHYHDHDSDFAVGAAIVLGGLLVGALLARSWADPPPPSYPVASPVAAPPVLGNCKPTTGKQWINGRWALLRGTWCTDQYGRGYILNDSVRFVRYLD